MLLSSAIPRPQAYHTDLAAYSTVDSLLEDVSQQMASSNLARRHSRGTGQRSGGSMRIVKPSSTTNSPRGSMTLNRRRTVMGDGPYMRRPMRMEQSLSTGAQYEAQQPQPQSRPMSWHPSSCMASQPMPQFDHTGPNFDVNDGFGAYGLPPTPAVYSGYTSPASTFSPLSQPFLGYDQQYPYVEEASFFPPYAAHQPSNLSQHADSHDFSHDMVTDSIYTHFDWTNFAANGFNGATAPPTPENYLPIQHPEHTIQVEGAIPYRPLEEDESAGEELIGMGLYDTPEKAAASDLMLDKYRALMMQHVLGAGHRKAEPTGKGLKLEEAWVPTASDDSEDDGEGEEDDDAEGSPAAEEVEDHTSNTSEGNSDAVEYSSYTSANIQNFVSQAVQTEVYSGQYHQNGWL